MSACLDDNALSAYADGVLTAAEVARVDAHISECASCRQDLSAIAGARGTAPTVALGSTRPAPDAAAQTDDLADAMTGETIGRYVLMREHARGGMGVVAIAYDPELDRNVALKLLRPEITAELGDDGRDHLRDEARAMAKLDHENVVTVYDVGDHAGRIFLAMELVDGVNLRVWLAAERRHWRDILRTYLRAGRGLAAAHRAGMVHRDFKPDNVLCGPGERVRVTDFGLARGSGTATGTATGIAGTLAYMAPEVLRGERATARSDQWSFCIALHEALFGARPFAGTTHDELVAAIRDTPLAFPRTAVPSRVTRAIARGLARDPAARFPSLDALLAELSTALHRPRVAWIAAAATTAIALAATGAYLARDSGEVCAIPRSLIDGAWSPARAAELDAAFAKSGRKHAADSARRVRDMLDRYADDWLAARADACEATRVRGDQSEAALDLRMRCLDRRRDELEALTRLLAASPSPDVVDRAVEATHGLHPVAACSATGVANELPMPADPAKVAQITALDRELAGVSASLAVRRVETLSKQAHDIVARARELGYPPLLARAYRVLARLVIYSQDHAAAERTLDEALAATAAAHDDRGTADVWVDLVGFTAMQKGDPALALQLAKAAEAALLRVDAPPRVVGAFEHARGTAYATQGKYEEAGKSFEAALAKAEDEIERNSSEAALCNIDLRLGRVAKAHERCERVAKSMERRLGPDHPAVGFAMLNLGTILMQQHRNQDAIAANQRAIAILGPTVGEQHISYAMTLNNLGMLHNRIGDHDAARRHFERAIAVFEAKRHPDLYLPISNLGNLERALGRGAEARKHWERAAEIAKSTHGEESDRYARALYSLGSLDLDADQIDSAAARYQRSLDIAVKLYGEAHPQTAEALDGLGFVHRARNDCKRAITYQRRAVAANEAIYGPDHPAVAQTLTTLADCQLALGDRAALANLERALPIHDAHPGDPFEPALTRWTLAKALDQLGGDRRRVVELATAARALYAKSPAPEARAVLPTIDRWIAKRRR